jgi:hypothetical protein
MSGLGVSEVELTTQNMLNNRLEVLKCLLACFSETFYITPGIFILFIAVLLKYKIRAS